MKRYLLDTSALLTLRDDEPGAQRVADILRMGQHKQANCFGCFISLNGVSKLRNNKELIMTYLQVKDLKKTRELWGRLERDRELVITKDGQPRAIMISVEPEDLESSLVEIRRALFSAAVGRVRRRAVTLPSAEDDIAQAIEESRRDFR